MRRRDFITLIGGAAMAWPVSARAQQTSIPVIGYVGSNSADQYEVLLRAFRLGLKATGFIEGQNLAVEYRWAEGRNDKLPELTADLVRRQVAVIVAPTTSSVLAAKTATKTIPIVFFTAGDPIDLGLVTSLSRPDSNLTGATTLTLEVGPKWLQLMREMVPNANSLALLINPTSPNLAETQSRDLQAAARSQGVQLHVLRASTFALSAGYGNFQGSNALGVGATGLLYDSKAYAVVVNAAVGFGLDTNAVGTRGVVSLQW